MGKLTCPKCGAAIKQVGTDINPVRRAKTTVKQVKYLSKKSNRQGVKAENKAFRKGPPYAKASYNSSNGITRVNKSKKK